MVFAFTNVALRARGSGPSYGDLHKRTVHHNVDVSAEGRLKSQAFERAMEDGATIKKLKSPSAHMLTSHKTTKNTRNSRIDEPTDTATQESDVNSVFQTTVDRADGKTVTISKPTPQGDSRRQYPQVAIGRETSSLRRNQTRNTTETNRLG